MITIVRRDNKAILIEVKDSDNVAYPLTDCQLLATVKRSPDDADASAVIAHTLTITNASLGQALWNLVPADTQYLLGEYFVDIQLADSTPGCPQIFTILRDTFTVLSDYTVRTSA